MADSYLNPLALDETLKWVQTHTTKIHITTSDTQVYSQVAGISIGATNAPTFTFSNITGQNGRQITFNDLPIVATKNARMTHIIFVDDTNSRVVLSKEIQLPKEVETSATVTIKSEDIEILVI